MSEGAPSLVTAAETAVGIPPWLIPLALPTIAVIAVGAGLYAWDLHERGIQAKKDAPVVQAAQVSTANATGAAAIVTHQQDNSQALTAILSALAQKTNNATEAVRVAPNDDAAFRAYLDGLRSLDASAGAPVGNLSGGSSATRPSAVPGAAPE